MVSESNDERDLSEPISDPPDELVDVLSDPHGRCAVAYLRQNDGPIELDELSRGVVGLLEDESQDEVGDVVASRVQMWLHHGHLPVLDQHGIVEYDPATGTIRLDATGDSLPGASATVSRQFSIE